MHYHSVQDENAHVRESLLSDSKDDSEIAFPSLLFHTNAYASSELWRDDSEFRSQYYDAKKSRMKDANAFTNLAKIRLETLSSKAATRILWLTYLTFLFAFLLPYYKHQGYLSSVERLSGDMCVGNSDVVSCTFLDKKSGMAAWIASVKDIAWRKAAVNLFLKIGTEKVINSHHTASFVLQYDLEMYKGSDTRKILIVAEKNQSVFFQCTDKSLCPKLTLLAMDRDTEKIEFEKTCLSIRVQFHNVYPNQIRKSVQYELSYEKPSLALGEWILRMTLLLFSIFALPLWLYNVRQFSGGYKDMLPIQKWLFLFAVVLILWQNPIASVMEWHDTRNIWLYRVSSICQALAESFFYTFWLQLIHLQGRKHSWTAHKLLFASVIFILDISMRAIHTPLFSNSHTVWREYLDLFVHLGCLRLSLIFVWVFWILKSNWRTAEYLRTLSYMSSRFQQLSYRFLVLESILVLIYVFVTCVIQFFSLFYVFSTFGREAFVQQSAVSFIEFFPDRPMLGKYIFISVYAYLILFVHLPPTTGKIRFMRHVSLHMNEMQSLKELKISAPRYSQYFYLETAVWLLEIAWQAYYDAPGQPSPSGYGEMNLDPYQIELVAHLRDLHVDTHVLIALSHDKSRLVIAFRGTTSRQNWKSNLRFHQNVVPIRSTQSRKSSRFRQRLRRIVSKIPLCDMALARVHSGFWEAYVPVRKDLKQVVRLLLDEHPNVSVYATGHSLGGGIAILAAYDFALSFDVNVEMYNFGGPRVGNPTFVKEYNRYVPNSYRVVMDGDIVPGVPRFWGLYQHVGTEVAIDQDGNIIVDPSFIEKKLHVSSKRKLSVHLSRVYRAALKNCYEVLSES